MSHRLKNVLAFLSLALPLAACSELTPPSTQSTPPAPKIAGPAFYNWAPTPPMGWNSWDSYGAGVNEEQTKANTDYMATNLASHGWQYITVDIQWYEPQAHGLRYRPNAVLTMDDYGRLLPAPNRFPSAAQNGFKNLAAYIHSKNLKMGIHLLRGIPRQAVTQNTPILNTPYHAADIADKAHPCRWNTDMWGVDMTKPGSQEYYDSVFALIASWNVDFVKVDDLSRPYYEDEVEAIRKAIDKTGRPIIFSTSPGATPLESGKHVATRANMWRISDDFWDNWKTLKEQFERCKNWVPFNAPGHYPDADMLPFGAVRTFDRTPGTHFTKDEQITVMTLWSICRSPLIFGGDLPKNDAWTLDLITNDEVIAVDQHSKNGHELFRTDDLIAWVADVPNSKDKYLAVFNARDKKPEDPAALPVKVPLTDLGFKGKCKIRDLWTHQSAGTFEGEFSPAVAFHGAGLYRLSGS